MLLVLRDSFGTTTECDVLATSPLSELLRFYADMFDIGHQSLQLRCHTSRMLIDLSETPKSLGLSNGDVLDVLHKRTLMPVPLAKRAEPVLEELTTERVLNVLSLTPKGGWTNLGSSGPLPPLSGLVWREADQTWYKEAAAKSSGSCGSGVPTVGETAIAGGHDIFARQQHRQRLRMSTPSPERSGNRKRFRMTTPSPDRQRALPAPPMPQLVAPQLPAPAIFRSPPMPAESGHATLQPAPMPAESGQATLPLPPPMPTERGVQGMPPRY
jgi:hypothetical protein